jgi:hypothetical protein
MKKPKPWKPTRALAPGAASEAMARTPAAAVGAGAFNSRSAKTEKNITWKT